uniref:Uncharacterized protein n=1 Tax=Arundo donax TaxID=35708 RepID=A0A0A8YBW2_ARUDO
MRGLFITIHITMVFVARSRRRLGVQVYSRCHRMSQVFSYNISPGRCLDCA